MSDGSGDAPAKSSRDGLDDTVPASEPPTDIEGNPMRSSRASIPPFQRYRLGIELGRGGMGRVVEAFDTQLGRTVAFKEVLPKGGAAVARRFIREIQITARLEHPAIVPLYDSGTTADGRPFYVMRRVTGRPLDEMIKRAPTLGERLALLPAVLAAIDAVAHAHRRGVIHRDLKPANILVGELGETVVIDWGLAKVVGEEEEEAGVAAKLPTAADSLQTQIGSVFGTPGFMPPEQARGEELGTRGDVYALGATLYQLLAGAPPHAGTSATEVLGSTLTHDVEPLGDAAPGSPPELVAIVDKALSFEAETRYPNAGALGEDVRRFLTGQLVAAHRYTPRQRIGRFAKRHRSSLTIAALAAVVLAVLAWVSVSRVMKERDAANTAQRAAEVDKQAAEHARDTLAERNDALIVTQARAMLDSNPTEALATLKQLQPTSQRLPEAKAVAQAAVMRGAWFAIRSTDETTVMTEMGPDGRLLLQLSRDRGGQMLRVWDLERRRLVLTKPYPRPFRALWIADNKVLAYDDAHPPETIDAVTNQTTPTELPPASDVSADASGRHLLLLDKAKHASLYDVATRALQPLWEGHAVEDQSIAPDGSWVALADKTSLVVLDASGKELGTRVGKVTRLVVSDHRQVAVLDDQRVFVTAVGPPLAWTEVMINRNKYERVLDLAYRGDELDLYVSSGDLLGYRDVLYTTRTGIRQFTNRLTEAGDHVMIVPSMDGKVYLSGDQLNLALPLPAPVTNLRLAARVGQSRFAVIGTGMILLFDLETVTPKRIPMKTGSDAVFVDDDTILAWQTSSEEWRWIDLRTGKQTPFAYDIMGLPFLVDIDETSGRVLVHEDMGPKSRLAVLRKGEAKRRTIGVASTNVWGRLVPGNAFVFGGNDGRVAAAIGDEDPREFVKLEGRVIGATPLGPLMFAAISDRGELVRGNLANGAVERANVTPGNRVLIGSDMLGRVLIGEDTHLLRWEKDRVVEIRNFDRTIADFHTTELGVMVTLVDAEMMLLDSTGASPDRRLFTASTRAPRSQVAGKLVIGSGSGEQLLVLEVPSLARWSVPVVFMATALLDVAPNARRVLQGSYGFVMIWDLPQVGPDFSAWLDDQTNAIVRDDLLAWPWQAGGAKP